MAADVGRFSGLPELLVLRLLSDREMYGYEIVQAIALRTGQVFEPGEGLIYPLLRGLEVDGALKSRRKSVKGRSRVTFDEWMRMDVNYIRRRSIVRDVKIMLETLPAVVLRRGAR